MDKPMMYNFEIWRAGKKPVTLYRLCADEDAALTWIGHQAHARDWGVPNLDWQLSSMTTTPISEVYEHEGDQVGYLCEITEELFAREMSNNCPNTELRGLSWINLCDMAIELLEALKK